MYKWLLSNTFLNSAQCVIDSRGSTNKQKTFEKLARFYKAQKLLQTTKRTRLRKMY